MDIRNIWRFAISDETIDDELEIFANTGWERMDTTDVDSLKKLMKNNTIKS